MESCSHTRFKSECRSTRHKLIEGVTGKACARCLTLEQEYAWVQLVWRTMRDCVTVSNVALDASRALISSMLSKRDPVADESILRIWSSKSACRGDQQGQHSSTCRKLTLFAMLQGMPGFRYGCKSQIPGHCGCLRSHADVNLCLSR